MQQLDQFLGFTFSQDMICAKQASVFAWIQNTLGIRNIYIAKAPDYVPVQVTVWKDDDGQILSGLKISHDGSDLLVIRGEGKNELGEYPNPSSDVQPPKQKLWYISLETPENVPREIAETGLACFRPGHSEIYFNKKGKLFSFDTAEEESEPELMISTRGTIAELSWSDQGNCLALSITRHKHSLIALYFSGNKQLKWLDPSYDRDCMPIWSPDGQHLAFYRLHGCKPDIADFWFSEYSDPFELRVADINSLTSTKLWETPKGHGLSLQEGARPLLWINSSELIFSHDAEGFDHIYRINTRSQAISTLTQGKHTVHSYAFSLESQWLYYNHNADIPHHYTLSRLNLKTGDQEELHQHLPEGAIVFNPAVTPAGDAYAIILASHEHPPTPAIFRFEDQQLHHHPQSDYLTLSQQFVSVEKVCLKSPDGLDIYGQLFMPASKGTHPALLTMHGGPWCQTLAGFSSLHGLSYAYAYCQYLAQQGFAVFSINYRGSSGYGKAFRQPGPYFWNGACEYQDVLTAGYWLADRDDVDGDQIGVWGNSYGGYLTAMSLARNSNLFKAGVDIEGCHNIPRELRQPHWGSQKFSIDAGETFEEVAERAQRALESSPWHYLDSWTSPALLIHPDDDRNVHFEESQTLYDELRKRKVAVEAMVIPDEVHTFLRHQPWVDVYQRATEFFQKYFKVKNPDQG